MDVIFAWLCLLTAFTFLLGVISYFFKEFIPHPTTRDGFVVFTVFLTPSVPLIAHGLYEFLAFFEDVFYYELEWHNVGGFFYDLIEIFGVSKARTIEWGMENVMAFFPLMFVSFYYALLAHYINLALETIYFNKP